VYKFFRQVFHRANFVNKNYISTGWILSALPHFNQKSQFSLIYEQRIHPNMYNFNQQPDLCGIYEANVNVGGIGSKIYIRAIRFFMSNLASIELTGLINTIKGSCYRHPEYITNITLAKFQ
jgi:hypothetical protein